MMGVSPKQEDNNNSGKRKIDQISATAGNRLDAAVAKINSSVSNITSSSPPSSSVNGGGGDDAALAAIAQAAKINALFGSNPESAAESVKRVRTEPSASTDSTAPTSAGGDGYGDGAAPRPRAPLPDQNESFRRKDRQGSDVPSTSIDGGGASSSSAARPSASLQAVDSVPDVDEDDIDFDGTVYSMRIELNEYRNRYAVTRRSTQQDIYDQTGCTVETKGKYYPDIRLATDRDPAIYLLLSAPKPESVKKAVKLILEKLNKALEFLKEPDPKLQIRERRQWPEARVLVGIDASGMNFNVRSKLVGAQGANVKHIHNETGARVQLKGRGSGYKEDNGMEADEPLYIHLIAPNQDQVDRARTLTESLVNHVKGKFEQAKQAAQYQAVYAAQMQQAGYPVGIGGYGMPHGGGMPAPPPSDNSAPPPPSQSGELSTAASSAAASQYSIDQTAALAAAQDPYAAYYAQMGYDYSAYAQYGYYQGGMEQQGQGQPPQQEQYQPYHPPPPPPPPDQE